MMEVGGGLSGEIVIDPGMFAVQRKLQASWKAAISKGPISRRTWVQDSEPAAYKYSKLINNSWEKDSLPNGGK